MGKLTLPPLAAALALMLLATAPARAQEFEACECDCYFGADCEPGFFCDWGENLFFEDSCWWRTPKPLGEVGAGCASDWPQWGKCDGVCAPTGMAGAVHPDESHAAVIAAGQRWLRIFNELSLTGGGATAPDVVERFADVGLVHDRTIYDVWRMVTEVIMLSRGEDSVVFPESDDYTMFDVAVIDLRGDRARKRNGDLAVSALLAEIASPGTGINFLREVDARVLDEELLRRVCRSDAGSRIACLHRRISDLGRAMATQGAADGGYQFPCPACRGDCVPNDAIDFADLLYLLSAWETDEPCADYDGSGGIGLADLLELLTRFGDCVPPP